MTDPNENPYVGPRPFERKDREVFFGRDGEARELVSLVVAERVVLLYAASGAGKTSLLHAGLVPLLEEEEGFEVLVGRIQAALDEDVQASARNAYTLGLLTGLGSDDETTLAQFLARSEHATDAQGFAAPRALVIDQLEELFTLYPRYWRQRPQFVEDLADALQDDPLLRVVLAMREDHVAQLEPYAPLLPRGLRARFRLERLGPDEAIAAVVNPTRATHRSYAPGVAEKLVADLMRFRADTGRGATIEIEGEYVEPVQLQVACQSLWEGLPSGVTEITEQELRTFGDVDEVLRRFYDSAIHAAALAARMPERRLRQQVEDALITSVGTRNTIYRRADEAGRIPNDAVDELENRHVIRAEWRAGARWYELTHDRLIAPIQTSNERFRTKLARRRRRRTGVAAAALAMVALAALAAALLLRPSDELAPASAIGLAVDQMTLNVPSARYLEAAPSGRGNAYYVVLHSGSLTGKRARVFGSLVDVRSGAVVAGPARATIDVPDGEPATSVPLWMRSPRQAGAFQLSVLVRSTFSKIELTTVSPIFRIAHRGDPATPFPRSNALTLARRGSGTISMPEDQCPPECSFVYPESGSLELTAEPASGWRFASWAGCRRRVPQCTVRITRPTSVTASFVPVPRTEKIGTTLTGKPIKVVRFGDAAAKRKILVVACVNPDECQGQAVIVALQKRLPPPNTELLLVPNLNPDKAGFGPPGTTSPNRAFPCNWLKDDFWSQGCFDKVSPFTREAQAAADLIRRTRPALTLWYFARTRSEPSETPHARGLKRRYPCWVELIGNARAQAVERQFARLVQYPPVSYPLQPNGGYPSSGTHWQAHEFPNAPAFWVTVPVGPLSPAAAAKHADAILMIARGLKSASAARTGASARQTGRGANC